MPELYLWVYEDARKYLTNCCGYIAEHRSQADKLMGEFWGIGNFKLLVCLKLDEEWVKEQMKLGLNDMPFLVEE